MNELHPVQQQIIELLATVDTANFNKIKPANIDPKLYVYHLDKLLQSGVIEKTDAGLYRFTDKGRHALLGLRTGTGFFDAETNQYVLLYLRWRDKILSVTRTRVPFLGYTGILSMHIDRTLSIMSGATRFLQQNVIPVQYLHLSLLLDVLYKSKTSGEVVQHSLMYVVAGELENESVPESVEEGTLSLLTETELLAAEKGYSNTKDVLQFGGADQLQYVAREYTDEL